MTTRASERFLQASAPKGMESLTLEAKATVNIEAAAEGQAPKQPTFDMLAYSGGVLAIGWAGPVYVDLAGLKATEAIAVLLDHDRSQIVGQGTAEITARQCKVSGKITGNAADPASPAGLVTLHAKNGFQWPCSIGCSVGEIEEVPAKSKVNVNGRAVAGPAIVVRSATLREVSFVSIGGDAKASAKIAASAAEENTMTFEQWVKARGKDIEALSDDEKAKLQAAYDAAKEAGVLEAKQPESPKQPKKKAAQEQDPAPEVSAANGVAELRAEAKRLALVNKSLAKHPDLLAKAIEENWSEEKAELQAQLADLKADRPKIPTMIVGRQSEMEMTAAVAEAAICIKQGIGVSDAGKSLIAQYGQKAVDAAEKCRGVRVTDIFRMLYAQAGVNLPWDVGSADWMKAAFSGSDIGSTILGAVANKALAAVIAEPTWIAPRISARASHVNFHTHTIYSLAVNGDLQEIAPTGEIQHLDLGKESWTRQLKTRGAILSVTRQDIINDDLGAFTRAATTLARKSMNAREKALFTLINATGAGSTFFTTAHGNYLSGAAFGVAALDAAVRAFRGQTGPDGDPILVEPAILMVSPTNEGAARRMLAAGGTIIATGLSSTSARTVEANSNIYAGRFGGQPVVSPYLELAALTGYSLTAFYLLADPAVLAAFEIAYLNGQESPTIQFFGLDSDVHTLGVSWRVFYDFGVAKAEYRAGAKHAGA